MRQNFTHFSWKPIIHSFFILQVLFCIIPMMSILSISVSDQGSIFDSGYNLIPSKINFLAYRTIFQNPQTILNGYMVSIFVTIAGTLLSVTAVSMISYAISRKDFAYRKFITVTIIITMFFNGGLIPSYILIIKYLHLKNNILVLILPLMVNTWHILVLRTFFQKVPVEMLESAKMDGAGEYRTFFSMVLPVSKPGIATITLFTALIYWNDWFNAMLYISKEKLIPLQYMLTRMLTQVEAIKGMIGSQHGVRLNIADIPTESMRMAMCLVAAGPMLFIFPFFQKYFVKGLTIGSVKG